VRECGSSRPATGGNPSIEVARPLFTPGQWTMYFGQVSFASQFSGSEASRSDACPRGSERLVVPNPAVTTSEFVLPAK
jgi:hypothetical protein